MKVSLDPKDYVGRVFDGVWDEALKAELRAQPEGKRAEFLSAILVLQERARRNTLPWFALADAVLTAHAPYKQFLREGIAVADASMIRWWLERCVQRIGMRRVVRVLAEEDEVQPQRVDLTTYWLPGLARTPKEKAAVKTFLENRLAKKEKKLSLN